MIATLKQPVGDLPAPDTAVSQVGKRDGDQWAVLAGARFILACIVMCHHLEGYASDSIFTRLGLGNGFAAVLAFFVISGYSMAHSLTRESSGARFYERRFWRIYPCYLFALMLSALPMILFATVFTHAPRGFADAPTRSQFLQAAVFLQGFTMQGDLPGNGVVWSLSIEAWLYALCPLFARWPPRALLAAFAASVAVGLVIQLRLGAAFHSALYGLSFLSLAWSFLLGFALYKYRAALTPERMLVVLAAAVAVAAPYLQSPEYYGSAVFAATLIAVYFCTRLDVPARWVKPLLRLGDLSFCLYLVHVPVMEMAQGFDYHGGGVIVASCFAMATATLYCIDYPIRAYRRRASRR